MTASECGHWVKQERTGGSTEGARAIAQCWLVRVSEWMQQVLRGSESEAGERRQGLKADSGPQRQSTATETARYRGKQVAGMGERVGRGCTLCVRTEDCQGRPG